MDSGLASGPEEMKTVTSFKAGEIICPIPLDCVVERGALVLSSDRSVRHGAQFNATVISRFIIATQHISCGKEVVVNLNTLVYDAGEDGDPLVPGFKNLSEVEKQLLYMYTDEGVRQQAIADGFIPLNSERGIKVVRTPKSSLVAVSCGSHEANSVVFTSTGVLLPFPTRSTIELPGEQHLRLTGGSEFIRHACEPNLRLEVDGDAIRGIALRPIEEGERLTFNYLYTEWDIAQPFSCGCNTYSCYGFIRGFQYLDAEQQMHLLPNASAAIQERYNAPTPSTAALAILKESTAVILTSNGGVAAGRHVPSGTVLFSVGRFRVGPRKIVVDGLQIPHSCDANTILLEGRLLASRPLVAGDPLTLNLSMLFYELPLPFECLCKSINCTHTVRGFSGLSDSEKHRLTPFTEKSVLLDALCSGFQLQSSNPMVKIARSPLLGETTYAAQFIPKGTLVFHVKGFILPFPTASSVFLGDGKHLLFADGAQYLAHSCAPNTRISVNPSGGTADWVATCDIYPGELVCYNYVISEWDMVAPFKCTCGSALCLGMIRGFRHLDERSQLRLWSQATTGVKSLFAQQRRSVLHTLDSSLLYVDRTSGEISLARDLPSGVELFNTGTVHIVGNEVVLDDVRIKHSCNPTAVLLEGRVVLCRGSLRSDAVTLNINHLIYSTPPFVCSCDSPNCISEVRGFAGLSDDQKDAVMVYVDPQVRAMATSNGCRIRSSCAMVEVNLNGPMGQATFAKCDIRRGTRFFDVSGLVIPFATMYTILLSEGRHLLFAGGAQCLAHSCDPNVRVITDSAGGRLDCIALRDIKEGELVSFNYLTTEWEMQSPFTCLCGARTCYRDIRGFKHLGDDERQGLWSMVTPAIKSLVTAAKGGVDAWTQIASTRLFVSDSGLVHVANDMMEGAVLIHVTSMEIVNRYLYVDGLRLRHHCSPTAALIDHKIVLFRAVSAGDEITIDLNCLSYTLPEEFVCNCGYSRPMHVVRGYKWLEEPEKSLRMAFIDPSVRAAALIDGYRINCSSTAIHIRGCRNSCSLGVFASINISVGTRFLRAEGLCLPFPTAGSIQLGERKHLLISNEVQFLSHSCDPNIHICVDNINNTVDCEALRDIRDGEPLTFNYATTEWELRAPVQCHCQSSSCLHSIRGFKFLTNAQRLALRGRVTSAMRHLAGTQAVVRLLSAVKANEAGMLQVTDIVTRGMVLLECTDMDIQPTQISIGKESYIIRHLEDANTVFVEGRFIATRTIEAWENLTVDINLFVYDMKSLFPVAFTNECQGFCHLDEMKKQRKLYLCEPPVRSQAMHDGWVVKSSSRMIEIRQNGSMGQTAYASSDIAGGQVLFHATGLVVPFPTMYTICVSEDRHLLFGDAAECIAHHCDPNVKVVVYEEQAALEFVTLRSIAAGEMVTFNYCTTEWVMSTPFVCLCGSAHCAGTIRGFSSLSEDQRQRLWPITSPVVRRYASKEGRTLTEN